VITVNNSQYYTA